MSRVIREDLSERLIHLTRDADGVSARERFLSILSQERILGSTRNIRGSHNCVCFSEAPISAIGQIIARGDIGVRYAPYGFMFSKDYLFEKGARPVIYQTEAEYGLLPEDLQYKHVRLDLLSDPKKDWTWEREWRLKADYFQLDIRRTTVILPSRAELEDLITQYQMRLRQSGLARFGAFPQIDWHFIILEDLGFDIS